MKTRTMSVPTIIFLPDALLLGDDECSCSCSGSTESKPRRFSDPPKLSTEVSTEDHVRLTRWEASAPDSDSAPPSPPRRQHRMRLEGRFETSCCPPRMPQRKAPLAAKSANWCLPPRCPRRAISQKDLLLDESISLCSCSDTSSDSSPPSLTIRAAAA